MNNTNSIKIARKKALQKKRKRKRLIKRIIATTLATVTIFTGFKIFEKINENKIKVLSIIDNQLPKNFESYIQNKKEFILKFSPTSTKYYDLYKTIDFIKELISNYEIDYPILYDIENELSLKENILLSKEFCDKLTSNGIYVGLYGTDESMILFEKYYQEYTNQTLDEYDKLILSNNNEIHYDGIYNMSINKRGKITFKYDLKEVINLNNLNSATNFIEDETYIVKSGDTLQTISKKYNIETSDLVFYNNLNTSEEYDPTKVKIIYPGDEITIPNIYGKFYNEENTNALVGIDVSNYQQNIDWKIVKNEGKIDFAIIQLNDFSNDNKDYILEKTEISSEFLKQIKGCLENNIPFGIYYYSHALTEEESKKEASAVIAALEEYIPNTKILYPIYMDIEEKEQQTLCKNNQFTKVVDAAMQVFEENGYFSGVYCNTSHVVNLGENSTIQNQNRNAFLSGDNTLLKEDNFLSSIYNEYTMWLVNNVDYNKEVLINDFIPTQAYLSLRDGIDMAQYTECGKCPGITNSNGLYQNVDINYANQFLTKRIEQGGFNKVRTKKN